LRNRSTFAPALGNSCSLLCLLYSVNSRPTMLIGQKGVKYGLQPGVNVRRQPVPVQPKLAVFGDDSDGEENVGAQVARHAASKATDSRVCSTTHPPPPPPGHSSISD